MPFLAIVNTPGYLPEVDPFGPYDNASEAWEVLIDHRSTDEENTDPTWKPETYREGSEFLASLIEKRVQAGTFILETPGYTGHHDLGVAFSVVEVLADGTVKA